MSHLTSLDKIFHSLNDKDTYNLWSKTRVAKITLGNSVIRVFVPLTKVALIDCFLNLPVSEVISIENQIVYDKWHLKQVKEVYKCLCNQKGNIKRLGHTGLMYGHATKLFNLFIGHLIFYSPYFPENAVKKVKHFLHVPLDKKVFEVLKACSVKNIPALIKDVTEESYYNLQNIIRSSALRYRIPPLYFDEYGWAFDKV